MPALKKLPYQFQERIVPLSNAEVDYQDRLDNRRQSVEVALQPDTAELDITYEDLAGSRTVRRIKPEALTSLSNGDLAIIGRCNLRNDHRSFALTRIVSAAFPGFASKPLSSDDLLDWLQPDVARLMAHDAAVNGSPIRPAKPFPRIMSHHAITDTEISDAMAPGPESTDPEKSTKVLLTDLAAEMGDALLD
jgi:hypothetical protein